MAIDKRSNGKPTVGQLTYQESGTMAEIKALVDNNSLIPGARYKITDTRTKHQIPTTTEIFENDVVEPLIITASSPNSFNEEAHSELYPADIIRFDFTNQLCEDGTTPRNGWITYRKDTIKNIEVDGYDWRHVRFRRRKILALSREEITTLSPTELTSALTISGIGFSTIVPRTINVNIANTVTHDAGQLTLTLTKDATTVTKPLLKSDNTDTFTANELADTKGQIVHDPRRDVFVYMNFFNFGDDLVGQYASVSDTDFNIGSTQRYIVDPADYLDVVTFANDGPSVKNISIKGGETKGVLSNNVFFGSYLRHFTIDSHSRNNTFTGTVYDCTIGTNLYGNIFHANLHWFVTGNEFFNNYVQGIGNLTRHVRNFYCGSEFYNNTIFVGDYGVANFGTKSNYSNQFYLQGNGYNFVDGVEFSYIYLNGPLGVSGRVAFSAQSFIKNSLIGYFDASNLSISKILVSETIFERDPNVTNLLGYTLVDFLKFQETLPTTSGPKTTLAIDEDGKAVQGDSNFTEKSFDNIAQRDAYEVLALPFQAFVIDDGDGKWATYKATAIGLPGTYTKIMDEDVFGAVMSDAQIATAYEGYQDVRRFTEALLIKLTNIQAEAEVNDDALAIIAKLSGVTIEEDKLPNSAIQGSPVFEDELVVDELTGTLSILKDSLPIKNSTKFLNSGTIYDYLSKLSAGLDPVFTISNDTKSLNFPKIIGKEGVIYAVSQDGSNNRFYSSIDGKFFVEGGTTSSWLFIDLDVSPHSIIIVQRNGGPGNVKRSTDNGATFTTITMPETLEITGIKHIGSGKWVLCSRTAGTGSVCAYSSDDGVTWTMATTPNTNAMQAIGYGAGIVFSVANAGTDRVLISTDYGVTYTASTPPLEFYTDCVYFLGHIVLMRAGVNADPYLTISDDQGTTWSQVLPVDDSAIELKGMTVIGEWLFIYGINGYIAKTNDLSTKTVLTAPTANDIIAMAETVIDGKSVIMATCENGVNNRILTTAE